jgi:dTDP-4-dehydrorhamnose 3,5-epimerase-like enzyme
MMNEVNVIVGGSHSDQRGTICFFNDFDMTEVKRFYRIKHHDTTIIRGWRGHKIEQRWFQVCRGAFEINLIEIDNWEMPNPSLQSRKMILRADEDSVLHIPAGFATSLKAVSANSEMIVFGDYAIEYAKNDDYLFPLDYFKA